MPPNKTKTRSERVATLKLPPGSLEKAWGMFQRGDVLIRIGVCVIAAVSLFVLTGGWRPPMEYRVGDRRPRNIVARVTFERVDKQATIDAQNAARRITDAVYANDPRPLQELQNALRDRIFRLLAAKSYDDVDQALWNELMAAGGEPETTPAQDELDAVTAMAAGEVTFGSGPPSPVQLSTPASKIWQKRAAFSRFRQAFADDKDLSQFAAAVKASLAEFEEHGLLESLGHDLEQGNQSQIRVYRAGDASYTKPYQVDQVRIGQATDHLHERLQENLKSSELADKVLAWLSPKLPSTLTFDADATAQRADEEIKNMRDVMFPFTANQTVLVPAGEPLTPEMIAVLKDEHAEYLGQLDYSQAIYYVLSKFGMYTALCTLCGCYIYFRRLPIFSDLANLVRLLLLVVLTVGVSYFAASSRFELIPLLLFSMTAVIFYRQELALLLSTAVALLTVLSLRFGLPEFVTLFSGMATTILALRHIRSRSKLIYVAIGTAVITMATLLGTEILAGRPAGLDLLQDSLWLGGCAVAAGLLMTGMLPFIERFFDVQTYLSLLELCDVAHPLLHELVRRAPGTYNHSINVASIGQAAAEAIGANGLLVRVGAYFHDIGKMLKPGYFVENQNGDENCHESLLPAMSTLVIIAHVKDGADLARKENLPNVIIDFIQQHHGTTLVEYFYRRANEQKESDPEAATVDEGSYRYPGPKPQTREAAVLMLSDAVESACRSLVDPAPARIESLVEEIAMNRLLDGQFDDCGLTLKELRTIQDSLIKSLTAVYHGRIKYPGQQSA